MAKGVSIEENAIEYLRARVRGYEMALKFCADHAPAFAYDMNGRIVWLTFIDPRQSPPCADCKQRSVFAVDDKDGEHWYWCGVCDIGG